MFSTDKMGSSPVILYLFPCNEETFNVVCLEQNQERRVSNYDLLESDTHPPEGHWGDQCLAIRFNQSHGHDGVMFGSSESADIFLTDHRIISRNHCFITFDESNQLYLYDKSQDGTRLRYDSTPVARRRRDFKWLLNTPQSLSGQLPLTLEITYEIMFKVVLQTYNTESQEYADLVSLFRGKVSSELPRLPREAETMHPSRNRTPPTQGGSVYLVKEVGEGAFGKVKRVWNVSTGEVYALKVPSWRDFTPVDTQKWTREIDIMKGNEHDHIIKCIGKAEYSDPGHDGNPDKSKHPGIIFEYAPFGSLSDYNKKGGYASIHGKLTTKDAVTIMHQLLSALEFLESRRPPICHRDIKPGNILIMRPPWTPDGILVKFADFGLAKAGETVTTNCGTSWYAAPELYPFFAKDKTVGKYNGPKVDIYSLGIVTASLVCDIPPWKEESWHIEVQDALSMNAKMKGEGSLTGALLSFILEDMLSIDPKVRKSASECLERAPNLPGHRS